MALRPVRRESEKPAAARAGFPRVLYVEDEDLNWLITERELRDEFALTRAGSAREAIKCLVKQSFDLILMDIQLSGSELDGIALAHLIKGISTENAPPYVVPLPGCDQIPIVFVTAYGSRYTKSSLCALGAAEVVHKPVDFPTLTSCIKRCQRRRD